MENIKKILNSEAGLIVKENNGSEKEVVDNRFDLFKQKVKLVENKDNKFYQDLIEVIGDYIEKLYDSKITDFPRVVLDKKGEIISQDYDRLGSFDIFNLESANNELAENLFNYACGILSKNKDVKLSSDTLSKLLNRNPKLFTFSVEKSYTYKMFDFKKLVKILNKNNTLKKSNIDVDKTYEILINTFQINNEEVFAGLISKKQFKNNHEKITELLNKCNSRTFVEITKIITENLDKNFDRLTIAKERKENNFKENLIIQLLKSCAREEDYNFIHNLLIDENSNIDYEYDYADYFGQTSLKEMIAFSYNKTIISDLLSKEENIQNTYWHGESKVQLYRLYAITGEYEKAIELFQKNYHYACDFTEDYENGFNKEGHAHGDITYKDSLVQFIEKICSSFEEGDIDYTVKRNIISRILNSENVKYINLEETLPLFEEVLSSEDFELLLDALIEKYNSNILGFISVEERDEIYSRYDIKILNEEEVKEIFAEYDKKPEKTLKK